MARDVNYDLEVGDELPESDQGIYSPLEDQLKRIVDSGGYPNPNGVPRWARIARYANAAAASSAAAVLRRRHGDTAGVEGFRFEVRRIDNGEASGLFVQYDADRIVPGLREENEVQYKQWKARQKEARETRAAEKARAEAEATAKKGGMRGEPQRHEVHS